MLQWANLGPGDVYLYIPHQANIRIINAAMDVLGIPRGMVFTNLERYGNTSAASIPLALARAEADGDLDDDSRLLLAAFGAGFTWGGVVVDWGLPAINQGGKR